MTKKFEIAITGYQPCDKNIAPEGYISRTFKNVFDYNENAVKALEQGKRLHEDMYPKLPKGWFSSPEEITKQPTYPFTPSPYDQEIKLVAKGVES